MKNLLLIGLLGLASCSMFSQQKTEPVEDYIQKLKSMRDTGPMDGPRYIMVPVPKPRS